MTQTLNRAERRAAKFRRPQVDRNQVNPHAVLAPVQRSRDFDDQEAAQLSNEVRMAWYRLTNGMGTTDDFDTVSNAMNVAVIRSEQIQHGDPAVQMVRDAMQSLLEMRARFERTELFGADAQAMQTMPPALDFYDDLLRLSTPMQMTVALKESLGRMARGQVMRLEQRP